MGGSRMAMLSAKVPKRTLAQQAAKIAPLQPNFPLYQAKSTRYRSGRNIGQYKITRSLDVPTFSMTAVELEHSTTGAKHLHIDRDDRNNVFSIAFKTNPPNATGVPHILEHTTLCGSGKYPVRDPFFKMLNRSLANFMNAMTGHDYTFFPFATTNPKDFNNLRDVYLDATLNPLLKEEDFYQEGWRLENEIVDDASTPLTFKGVVYNEMKGQMSSAAYLFYIRFQEAIYPSLNNSGGDPQFITDLSYPDLVDFQAENYHPSNSYVYTYGDMPVEEHLQSLEKSFSTFGRRPPRHNRPGFIKQPISLADGKDKRFLTKGPVDPMAPPDRQVKFSLSWFAGSPTDLYETFVMKIVSSLIMDGHSSPLYQDLIDTGIGNDFSVNTGLESMSAVNIFTVGLQGVENNGAEAAEEAIIKTLEEVATTGRGLEQSKIEAIIHQMELSKKDRTAQFGLNMLYGIVPGWVNNVDPLGQLQFDEMISRLQKDLATDGEFLQSKIKEYILKKPKVVYSMVPDQLYDENLKLNEKRRLEEATKGITPEDREIIYKRGLSLQEKQKAPEDLSCLPTLQTWDIPADGERTELQFTEVSHPVTGAKYSLQERICDTNGLTYFRALKPLKDLPADLIPYLPLFSDCLTNIGTTDRTMSELEDEIKLKTGALSASVNARPNPDDINALNLQFQLGGMALDKNVPELYRIWATLITGLDFDVNREKLYTLIKGYVAQMFSSLAESGHTFARSAASVFTPVGRVNEALSGVEQVVAINEMNAVLATGDEASIEKEIISKLRRLRSIILKSFADEDTKFFITCSPGSKEMNENELAQFLAKLTEQKSVDEPSSTDLAAEKADIQAGEMNQNTLLQLPFQVGYVGSSFKGVPYTHQDGPALQVLATLLTFKYLHPEIREKGGAYGGGATYRGAEGIFSFYSYRDPNADRTLKVIEEAAKFALEREWTEDELREAKLTIFQGIDSPTSIRSEGMICFVDEITDEMRQERRQRILDTSIEDVKRVAQEYLAGAPKNTVVLGPELQ